MKLADILVMISEDFQIDITDLGNEAVRSSELFQKYMPLYREEKRTLEKLESDRKLLISNKREYYSGNASAAVYQAKPWNGKTPATDIGFQRLFEVDKDIIAYDENLIVQRDKVAMLVDCMDEIKRRSYNIRNAIDWQKFINGA